MLSKSNAVAPSSPPEVVLLSDQEEPDGARFEGAVTLQLSTALVEGRAAAVRRLCEGADSSRCSEETDHDDCSLR